MASVYRQLCIIASVFFVIQILVITLSTAGILAYIKHLNGNPEQQESINLKTSIVDDVQSIVTAEQNRMHSKGNEMKERLSQLKAVTTTIRNDLNAILNLMGDTATDTSSTTTTATPTDNTALKFTKLEIDNFKHILGKSKYSYKLNVQTAQDNGFTYKSIIKFPFNFTLVVHAKTRIQDEEEYFAYMAGAFQTFFIMYSQVLSPEKAKAAFTNVVRHGYRWPSHEYPGGSYTAGEYYPGKRYFIVREGGSYSTDAHEFGHAIQYVHNSNFWGRINAEVFIDAMANIVAKTCPSRSYSDLRSAMGVDSNDRYDSGPSLIAFLFSHPTLRSVFTHAASSDCVKKEVLNKHSHLFEAFRDYCKHFIDAITHHNDFWRDINGGNNFNQQGNVTTKKYKYM